MSRVKTFDATGVPPGGRLFAGDLNSIQDKYADASNFAQTVDLAVLRIGDTAIQFLKFGTGEARLTGALRTDGILRGLGGLFAGAFTTAQRDAIAAGFRPFTLVVFNTTTNRFEWNAGTDAAPNWQPVANTQDAVPVGTTIDWPWINTQLPANYLLCYGQAILKASYPVLDAIASASGYPWGSAGTTFNLPDYRGRVGIGKDDMGGTAANRVTTAGSGINGVLLGANGGVQNVGLVTGEMPTHSHGLVAATITGTPALSGAIGNGSLAVGVGSLALPQHVHDLAISTLYNIPGSIAHDAGGFVNVGTAPGQTTLGASTLPAITGAPSLSGSVSNGTLGVNANTLDVGGTTDNAGSGTAHNNMQPSIVVNVAMRVA